MYMRIILLGIFTLALIALGCDGCDSDESSSPASLVDESEELDLDTVEDWLQARATPLNDIDDLAPIMDAAGDRQLILMGEASHGTREFYEWRAEMSMAIADGDGLDFVGIEGDWHAARAADRYVMGEGDIDDVETVVVDAFERWPQWMWANEQFAGFLQDVRRHNDEHSDRPIRIYGIDMHGFFESLERLKELVGDAHPDRKDELAGHLRCLEQYAPEPQRYLAALNADMDESCEEDTAQAVELTQTLFSGDDTESLSAREHARVVESGEAQYRGRVVEGGAAFWNVRASHMFDVARALLEHHGSEARGAIWAHNTHIGDARATDMGDRRRVNIGQLSRESLGEDSVLAIGFSTYQGEVIAGRQWGTPLQKMEVPSAPPGTLDELLNRYEESSFFAVFGADDGNLSYWRPRPGQRAIGVVYQPIQEYPGNYVATNPAERYDTLIFLEETTTLDPL